MPPCHALLFSTPNPLNARIASFACPIACKKGKLAARPGASGACEFFQFGLNLGPSQATHARADCSAMQKTSDEVLISRIEAATGSPCLYAAPCSRVSVCSEAGAQRGDGGRLDQRGVLDVWRQAGKLGGRSAARRYALMRASWAHGYTCGRSVLLPIVTTTTGRHE